VLSGDGWWTAMTAGSDPALTLCALSLRWAHDCARHADRPPSAPREAEVLAFKAGCEDYCEREVDEVEWQGDRVYLHLGARRDDPPRG
jgi:hypothetical protein